MRRFILIFSIILGFGSAATAQVTQVRYVCDIEGQQGLLRATLETIGGTGIVGSVNGDISVIGGQGSNTWVTGDLQTPTAYYTFSGENQFADFTDTASGARFRVEWVPQPGGLVIVVNPFGQAVRYYCQQSR